MTRTLGFVGSLAAATLAVVTTLFDLSSVIAGSVGGWLDDATWGGTAASTALLGVGLLGLGATVRRWLPVRPRT